MNSKVGNKTKVIFNIDKDLLKEFDKFCEEKGTTRTAYLTDLIKDCVRLRTSKPNQLVKASVARTLNDGAKLPEKLLSDVASTYESRLNNGENVWGELTNGELVNVLKTMIPKNTGDVDEDLKADLLSLREATKKLPSVEDISLNLRELKADILKLEKENLLLAATAEAYKFRCRKEDKDVAVAISGFIRKVEKLLNEYAEVSYWYGKDIKPFDRLVCLYKGVAVSGDK